ncbi:probable G-protein coupled receptor 139 [Hemiscyllium ocellatum]|uniref:probable G-protein coupled receptor 139 n=1 Tax=Hemiscyllium ocellatum TaxID=170820 RepID=UPI002966645A|nr:probable G-protein coupled receptor 139 [Hemiscyllium ocellatum]
MHGPPNGLFFANCYPIIAIIGVPANLVAIIILSRGRCNLSRCVSYYLVAIAVSDFLVILMAVIFKRIVHIYFRYSVMSTTPASALSAVLIYISRDCSVWLTAAFTIDRFVAICWQSLKVRYCTEKTASFVIGTMCALSCVKNFPFYFVCQPLVIVDGVPWFCDIKSTYYTLPAWQAYHWLDRILMPFLPFFLIFLLNILTARHIIPASRACRRLQGIEDSGTKEMANRRRSIILLFAISLSFLLLWVTYVGNFVFVRAIGKGYISNLNFNDPQYILQEMSIVLTFVSSCNNVFIYAPSQNKFREEVKKTFLCPFNMLVSFTKP